MKRELYLSGQRVDLPDSSVFNLTFQVAEPGKFQIYGSGSSTIKLPFTPANDRILSRARFIPAIGDSVFSSFSPVRYYEDGILLIDNATATLVGVSSDAYEICVTFGNVDIVNKMKATNVNQLVFTPFTWDNVGNVLYPQAEMSDNPKEFPTFYLSGTSKRIRPGLTRPCYPLASIYQAAGIRNIPTSVSDYISGKWLQVNSNVAYGRYQLAKDFYSEDYGNDFKTLTDNNDPLSPACMLESRKIMEVDLSVDGTYKITALRPFTRISEYFSGMPPRNGMCFWLTPTDYGESVAIGRTTFIDRAFMDYDGQNYVAMYRGSIGTATGSVTTEEIDVIGFGFAGVGQDVTLVSKDNIRSNLMEIAKGKYYLYACPADNYQSFSPSDEVLEGNGHNFAVTAVYSSTFLYSEQYDSSASTNIISPDDPVLTTNPPDVMTMLGYKTQAEIVEDFMRMFPLMVTVVDGELVFFGLSEVRANKTQAYEWSRAFVALKSVGFGNSNLASENWCRFKEYEGYKGFRADASFKASGGNGEASQDYSVMQAISNYEGTVQNAAFGDIPYYATFQTEFDDKAGKYVVKSMNDVGNVLYHLAGNITVVADEDGNGYRTANINGSLTTFSYIIDNYWRDFIEVCGKQKTVEVSVLLKAKDIVDFDFRKPVYFSQIAAYIFVKKITYKGSDTESTIEGIII